MNYISRYRREIYLYCEKTAFHLTTSGPGRYGSGYLFKVCSIHSFNRKKASFSTWIFRIAHNLCVDLIRKQSRRKTYSIVSAKDDYTGPAITEENLVDPSKSIEEEFEQEQEVRRIE